MRQILSPRALRTLRQARNTLLPDLCNILEGTRVKTGGTGYTTTYAAILSGQACRLDETQIRSMEKMVAGKVTAYNVMRLYLKAGTAITAQNRIQVTTKSNRIFEIVGIPTASWETLRAVEVVEVGAGEA